MAKELPYFKFHIAEWLNGDITLEIYELQGIFINICAYYWSKDCEVTILNIKKKFRGLEEKIDQLITSDIIKTNGEYAKISFLDEQLKSKEVQAVTNRINGLLGGRPPKPKTEKKPTGLILETETKPKDNPIKTNIDKSIVKYSKVKKIRQEFIPPSISEVIDFFAERGCTQESAQKAFNHYDLANWKDTNGKQVLNWKQKMNTVWIKEENKIQSLPQRQLVR